MSGRTWDYFYIPDEPPIEHDPMEQADVEDGDVGDVVAEVGRG
jgi:hypothetical protein